MKRWWACPSVGIGFAIERGADRAVASCPDEFLCVEIGCFDQVVKFGLGFGFAAVEVLVALGMGMQAGGILGGLL